MSEVERSCPFCKQRIGKRRFCPSCGTDTRSLPHRRGSIWSLRQRRYNPEVAFYSVPDHLPWKNPQRAAALGALIPGSGHIYVGKYWWGLGIFILASLLLVGSFTFSIWCFFVLGIVWYWQTWNAYDWAETFDWLVYFNETPPW